MSINLAKVNDFFNSIIRFGHASPVAACTAEGVEDDMCAVSGGLPEAGQLYVEAAAMDEYGFVPFGADLTFTLTYANACNGEDPIEVWFDLGPYHMPMTLNEDGSYSVTVAAVNCGPPAIATVYDYGRNTEAERRLDSLPPLLPGNDPETDGECYSIPEPGAVDRSPNDTEIVQGSGTQFTWRTESLTDCNGNPLLQIGDNTEDVLGAVDHNNYQDTTLVVVGSVKPTIEGGSMRFEFADDSDNILIHNLYLPSINPLQIISVDNFMQVGEEIAFSLEEEVSGALSYEYTVTTQSGTTENLSQESSSPACTYIPTQTGSHQLHLSVETYTSEIIETTYTFTVHEGTGQEQGACYEVPAPGLYERDPNDANIIQGADTEFTWTIDSLFDCNTDALTLIDDNLGDILIINTYQYDDPLAPLTLVVGGQILPSVTAGTLQVRLEDDYGNSTIENLYLPTVNPIEIQSITPYMEQNQPIEFVFPEVAGASSYYIEIGQPDGNDDGATEYTTYAEALPSHSYTPTQAGNHTLLLSVTTYTGEILITEYNFVVNTSPEEVNTCYSIPDAGAYIRDPFDAEMIKGADTEFTWGVADLTDCFMYPLSLGAYDNLEDMLENTYYPYTLNYDDITQSLTVTGRILPNIDAGSLRIQLGDIYGNSTIQSLYLPSIVPPQIETVTLFVQVNTPAEFVASEVPGATNYHFEVDGDPSSVQDGSATEYAYTPTQTGNHILNLDITTYAGDIISVSHPFVVSAEGAQAQCYAVPDPGITVMSPFTATIIRGDNTEYEWTINDVTNCLGNPLNETGINNLSDMLYDESMTYSGTTLTVAGKVRSLISGGSIRVTFIDDWGQTKIISMYPPTIEEAEIVITDPWITVSEDVDLTLLTEPTGAFDYTYTFTRQNNTYSPGSLATSAYTLPSAYKTLTGTYDIDLVYSCDDGETVQVLESFAVNQD